MIRVGSTINVKFTKKELEELKKLNIKTEEKVQEMYENGAKKLAEPTKK